jgi:phospholipid-binding lipoprotein MlaA
LLAGVVSFPVVAQAEDTDPWESMNRKIFVFNEWLDEYLAKPVAKGYREVMPSFADKGVTNFFSNLGELENTVNNALQLKVEGAGVSVARFAINSTLGWFGLVDIATHAGLSEVDEDFGQTLGYWGTPNGPYLVLPLLGPSTIRDTVGKVGDSFTDPMAYEPMSEVLHPDQRLALTGLKAVDKRADLLGAERVIFGEDKYAFMRDAYLQTREYKVHDGEVEDPFADSTEEFDDLPE